MAKTRAQLPYPTYSPVAPILFLGIHEVAPEAKKRPTPRPKKVVPPPLPLPGRRVTFLDISPKTKV